VEALFEIMKAATKFDLISKLVPNSLYSKASILAIQVVDSLISIIYFPSLRSSTFS
jgi:hypothetical protein